MTVFNSRINTNSDGFRKNREEMLDTSASCRSSTPAAR